MDGSAFNRLPVTGVMRFAVFGMVVAALIVVAAIVGVGYLLYVGALAVFS